MLKPEAIFSGIETGFTAKLTEEQASQLQNNPNVERVERDAVVAFGETTTTTTTTTTTSSTQTMDWGVSKVGGPVAVSGKTAWIIDSGIQLDHPDLNVDKARSRSFLYSTDPAAHYSSPEDEYGHGTGVAGIIGAKNNTIGTVGIAPGVSVVSLRVMDRTGYCTVSKLVKALNYVAANGKAGDVVNISLGTPGNTTLDNAVKTVAAKGIFVAIASGNSHVDCKYTSPARVNATNVYTVSAFDKNGYFAPYSNYGASVDFSLPGSNIRTTAMGSTYKYVSGTSEAAPHMAGLLLVKGKSIASSGTVIGDPDAWKDKMAHK
jgi:hypothetical protein